VPTPLHRRTGLASVFLGGALGAAAGVVTAGLEVALGRPGRLGTLAAYVLLGWILAAASRLVLGLLAGETAGRLGALAAAVAFASLHLAYFGNVRILPGEPYLSHRSLLLDVLILALVGTVTSLLARATWLRQVRTRWSGPLAALGAAALAGSVGILAWAWPRAQVDPRRAGHGPNLMLVVLDSARRDHLGLHGYARQTSPQLDALVTSARVYDLAYASSSWTVPSVESLLTTSERPLPRKLADLGYVTACFTDNPHLNRESPLLAGCDRVERSVPAWRRLVMGSLLGDVLERLDPGDDRRLVDRALRWAGQAPGPFFLYVHLMDSHTPYRQPPIDGRRRKGRHIEFPTASLTMTPEEVDDVVARYDGGVRSADAQAGRLLSAAPGWKRSYLAVVTADHGESLGEDGRWFHGGSLAPELLAVPMMALGEGVNPGRARGAVGHAAVPHTLLQAAGGAPPAVPLEDLRTSDGGGPVTGGLPPVLAYRVVDGYKLVVPRRDGQPKLFDVRSDPGERVDVAARFPQRVETLARGLESPGQTPVVPPDLRERLRSLGYVDAP
jgi:hypothetical protein